MLFMTMLLPSSVLSVVVMFFASFSTPSAVVMVTTTFYDNWSGLDVDRFLFDINGFRLDVDFSAVPSVPSMPVVSVSEWDLDPDMQLLKHSDRCRH